MDTSTVDRLAEELEHRGRRLLLRPVCPQDASLYADFLAQISQSDMRRRFFSCVRQLSPAAIAQFTRFDQRHDMAFVAVPADDKAPRAILAVAQAHTDAKFPAAEFALLVRSDLKGQGLGRLLLLKLIRYCRQRGTQQLRGFVFADNTPMARLSKRLGFRPCGREGNVLEIALVL